MSSQGTVIGAVPVGFRISIHIGIVRQVPLAVLDRISKGKQAELFRR